MPPIEREFAITAAGVLMLAFSGLIPWTSQVGFPPPVVATFRYLGPGSIQDMAAVAGTAAFVGAFLLALLLYRRDYLLMRSLSVGILTLTLPAVFFLCCFKSSVAGLGGVVAIVGIGLILFFTPRLKVGERAARPAVSLRVRALLAASGVGLGLLLLYVPSMSVYLASFALVLGSLHYLISNFRVYRSSRVAS